jgi:hypothetical protein
MIFWIAYTTALILVAFGAMLSEGVEKLYAAKIAGGMLIASVFGLVILPNLYLDVDEDKVASVSPPISNAMAVSPRGVKSSNHPAEMYQNAGSEMLVDTDDGLVGVDLTPICGGKHGGDSVRVETAEANKDKAEQANSARRC